MLGTKSHRTSPPPLIRRIVIAPTHCHVPGCACPFHTRCSDSPLASEMSQILLSSAGKSVDNVTEPARFWSGFGQVAPTP